MDDLDYLSVEDLLDIGKAVVSDFKLRDLGLLQSAVIRPKLTVFGSDAYTSFPEKVASLMHAIAKNHALTDGNKRLAWASCRIFCLINGKDLQFTDNTAEELIKAIAAGKFEVSDIVKVISNFIVIDAASPRHT